MSRIQLNDEIRMHLDACLKDYINFSKKCTKELQDFIYYFLQYKSYISPFPFLLLQVTASTLAAKIVVKMEVREKKLFENDVFAAAVYMDPRYKVLLSQKQRVDAQTHLVRLHDKILSLQPSLVSDNASGSSEDPISLVSD